MTEHSPFSKTRAASAFCHAKGGIPHNAVKNPSKSAACSLGMSGVSIVAHSATAAPRRAWRRKGESQVFPFRPASLDEVSQQGEPTRLMFQKLTHGKIP